MGGTTEQEILRILEEAIKREQAAFKLYSRGESLAGKQELKEVFARLASEEQGHEELLRRMYREFKK